jgi:exopolysaccharide production protein ExoQ
MNPALATLVYVLGIAGLFRLDRDRKVRTSKALWIPLLWLLINGSRPVSMWFDTGPTIADQYANGSPLDAFVFGVLLACGFATLAVRRAQVEKFLSANTAILLFVAYCAISALWSDYSLIAFKRWFKSLGDLVMVLIVLTDPQPLAAIRRFLTRAGFVLLPLSVLLIKYYPNLGRSYNPWTWLPMYCGVTTFKNLLGMTCLVCGLASLWCFMTAYRNRKEAPQRGHLIAHGIVTLLALWLIWTADSKTSFSCFGLAGGVMVMTSLRWVRRRPAAVHILVASVVALSLTALFFDSSGSLVQSLGRDATLTGRTAIWNLVFSLTGNPLLGTGFESFWMGSRLMTVWKFEMGIQEAHNGYIEAYANLGWIGVGLLSALIVTGYRNAICLFRRNPDAGRIMVAYFIVGVVYSLTEAGFRMLCPVWIVFLLAIAAVPRSSPLMAKREAFKASPVRLRSAFPAAAPHAFEGRA